MKKKLNRAKRHLLKPSRRRNSGGELEAAAELSEKFHGRPARKVREIDQVVHEPETLAELGALKELHVILRNGQARVLTFRGVALACSPSGDQLYLAGGDQELDLAELGVKGLPKANVLVGELWKVVYKTKKAFHNFESTEYIHEFGEDRGGQLPTFHYDTQSHQCYISGGTYQVRPEGIVN